MTDSTVSRDWKFDVEVAVRISRLLFDPVNGRRTVYAKLTLGRRTFWVMRWDTPRCEGKDRPRIFARSRDGLMCWTAGMRKDKS